MFFRTAMAEGKLKAGFVRQLLLLLLYLVPYKLSRKLTKLLIVRVILLYIDIYQSKMLRIVDMKWFHMFGFENRLPKGDPLVVGLLQQPLVYSRSIMSEKFTW
jgi:hypothetical protein